MADWTSQADGNWSSPFTWNGSFAIHDIVASTKTIRVVGDATSAIAPADLVAVSGTVADDATYTVSTVTYDASTYTAIVVLENDLVNAGAAGLLCKDAVPADGDNVSADDTIVMDIQVPALASLAVNGTLSSASLLTDYLSSYSHSMQMNNGSTLKDTSTSCVISTQSGTVTFDDVAITTGSQAGNLTVNGTLLFDGSFNNDGATILIAGGTLTGNDLTIANLNEFDFNGGALTGNVTFTTDQSIGDASSGALVPIFGGGGTIRVGSISLPFAQGVAFGGTIQVSKSLSYDVEDGGSTATNIQLLTKAAQVVSAIGSNTTISYVGPAGGAMGNMSISL